MSPTKRQMDALRFLRGYQIAKGYCPTLQEVADGLGLVAKSGPHYLLMGLEERGHISTADDVRERLDRYHAIEVLTEVAIPRAPDGAPLYFVPAPDGAKPRPAALGEAA